MSATSQRLIHWAYGLYAVVSFAIILFPTLLILVFLPGLDRRRRLAKAAASLAFKVAGTAIDVTNPERIPDTTCIVVANHASYLDGIILTATLPPHFTFVIKQEMLLVPMASLLLRRLGSEFVERGKQSGRTRDARRLVKRAQSKEALVFFPEGTFDEQPGIKRFKPGAFTSAKRAGIAVIPIAIIGSRRKLPSGRALPRPGPIRVQIGEPLDPGQFASVSTLGKAARQSIVDGTGEPDLLA